MNSASPLRDEIRTRKIGKPLGKNFDCRSLAHARLHRQLRAVRRPGGREEYARGTTGSALIIFLPIQW